MKAYKIKNTTKHVILPIQGSGMPAEWETNNFPLNNIRGLQSSC